MKKVIIKDMDGGFLGGVGTILPDVRENKSKMSVFGGCKIEYWFCLQLI